MIFEADIKSIYDIRLFSDAELASAGTFQPFGADDVTSVVENKPTDPDRPVIENAKRFNETLFTALSANL